MSAGVVKELKPPEPVADPPANGNGNGPASHPTLTKALLAVQADMPAIDRDGTNPHFKSKFTTLGNLIAKARPVCNAHGIVFTQFPSSDEHGPTLVTILMHESGERLEFAAPLILTKQDPQGQGSAITYMRRYALAAALGISDQEDGDGNGTRAKAKASAPASELSDERVAQIITGMKAVGWTGGQISLAFGAVGAEAQAINRADSIEKAVRQMTSDQADAFELRLQEAADAQ